MPRQQSPKFLDISLEKPWANIDKKTRLYGKARSENNFLNTSGIVNGSNINPFFDGNPKFNSNKNSKILSSSIILIVKSERLSVSLL